MGVHGLTTYLRKNRRILAKSFEYPSSSTTETSIIIDGWSFIYELFHRSSLPWVYGGEHEEFEKLVVRVVKAWINVGLKVYFVFDGATPELKFRTVVSRLTQSHVQPSLLFFRTSRASRSTPQFLHESRIIPPLLYPICIHALRSVQENADGLEIHHADEEGDPYAVELAAKVGGFVAGNDSDFVILNSDGYLGYIPLDSMLWSSIDNELLNVEDQSGFQTFRKPKGKKIPDPRLGNGLIPPDVTSNITLSFIVYKPSVLAAHLKLPVSLLPLLGALVGNDYSNQISSSQRNAQSLFFQRQLSLSQRIDHVAATLDSILSASSQKRKQKHHVGSVMDLIAKAVEALLVRSPSTMGSGEVDNIVTTVVDATLQYALPKNDGETNSQPGLWPTQICALHEPEVCALLPLFSRSLLSDELSKHEESEKLAMREKVRALYVRAYRTSSLTPEMMDILSTGTFWPRLFLENPDLENIARSVGRPIRQWVYAILQDSVGLPERPGANETITDERKHAMDGEIDGDELIDVVEEDSETEDLEEGIDGDPLAHLRGELERLRLPEDRGVPELPKSLSSSPVSPTQRPATVVEYIRRGTRVVGEETTVPLLADLISSAAMSFDSHNYIPILLRSEDERLTVFLHALGSNTPLFKSLPSEQLIIALALRWVINAFSDRARHSGGIKEREMERWTKSEARAFLASFSWAALSNQLTSGTQPSVVEVPPIIDRNIQLMAQALMALDSIADLSQVLLLSERVPSQNHLFSGKKFHSFLTGTTTPAPADIPDGLWDLCVEGLEDSFGEEWRKKAKKGAQPKTIPIANSRGPRKGFSQGTSGSLFDLLSNMEV